MLDEFKKFIMRGNVIDLAIGVIIGAAFGKIVDSLVKDVIMPPIGVLLSGIDFSSLYFNLTKTAYPNLAEAQKAGAATINYGVFINACIQFAIVGLAVFLLIKLVNKAMERGKSEAAAAPPAPPRQEVLLQEIRDLLKQR